MATAKQLLDLLAEKHAQDLFIPECKDGPTHGAEHLRLDAWAMKRSWSNPVSYGYEIKVTRRDFLQDEKWSAYLAYCTDFYFVCADGVLKPSDLPPEAGLITPSKNLTRLFVRKKAVRRPSTQIPEDFYRYILMCRVVVKRGHHDVDEQSDTWHRWLEKKIEDRELGHACSKAVRQTLCDKVYKADAEIKRLSKLHEKYQDVRKALGKLGIDDQWFDTWTVQRRVEQLKRVIPQDLEIAAQRLRASLDAFDASLSKERGDEKPRP